MKKQFFHFKLGVVPLMLLFCSVNAQTARTVANSNNTPSKEVVFNNSGEELDLTETPINSGLSTKALKNFNKNFKESENAEWYQVGNTIKAQYKKDGVETNVFYTLKGNWLANIRTYNEDKMPGDIRHRVRSTYYDYSIFQVQEVTVRDKTAYLVNLQDENFIKTIRIADNGEMDEYQVIGKSSR